MNHLAHFRVAHPEPSLIVGGFLGDFVKGRLTGNFSPGIEAGIRLHRAVDAFSDRHPVTRQSVRRFDDRFRRFGPIIVDIVYDHFLARHWSDLNDVALDTFCSHVFNVVQLESDALPDHARRVAERMQASRSMQRYADQEFVARSLTYLGSRLKRTNPLDEAFDEFRKHEAELYDDFMLFFPELINFCNDWKTA